MPELKVKDGTELFYDDWGAGRTLLFVHGWCLGSDMWEYQRAPLADAGFRCIAYDARGCGRSDRPSHGYDFDTLADDLAAVLEHLDLRDVVLVGHSMGCGQIVRYAARHGLTRVAKVVLVSTIAPFPPEEVEDSGATASLALNSMIETMYDDRAGWATAIAPSWFGHGLPGIVLSTALMDWGVRLFLGASLRAAVEMQRSSFGIDLRPDLQALTVPTLLVHGDSDTMSPFENASQKVAEAVPRAALKIYKHASHGLFVSHKGLLNEDIRTFAR